MTNMKDLSQARKTQKVIFFFHLLQMHCATLDMACMISECFVHIYLFTHKNLCFLRNKTPQHWLSFNKREKQNDTVMK